jgi:hypothetical protein
MTFREFEDFYATHPLYAAWVKDWPIRKRFKFATIIRAMEKRERLKGEAIALKEAEREFFRLKKNDFVN